MITAALAALAATALPLSATAATARPAGAHPAGAHPVRDRGAGASVVQERADRGQGATGPRDPRHYLTDISATLAADGGISGTVTTAGHAVSGACVGAYPGTSASPAGLAITGAGGAYQIAGLIPGRYHVEFSSGCGATGYRIQWYHGRQPGRLRAGHRHRGDHHPRHRRVLTRPVRA